jgi:hypothetical protein
MPGSRRKNPSPDWEAIAQFRQEERRWLADHHDELERHHAGEWLAVDGYKLIAHGYNLTEVLDEARASGAPNPLVTAVRQKEWQGAIIIR